jgi:hypothetical protein
VREGEHVAVFEDLQTLDQPAPYFFLFWTKRHFDSSLSGIFPTRSCTLSLCSRNMRDVTRPTCAARMDLNSGGVMR